MMARSPKNNTIQKKTIYFVTSNENKLKEARAILKDFDIQQIKMDLPELQGEPEDIVREKAMLACNKLKKPVFVEDTCLCFEALGGLPGPYIKHFEEKLGYANIVRLLDSFKNKNAKAIVSIGYCEPGKSPQILQGTCDGSIVSPRGKNNFGWDVIFVPKGYDKTLAEMPQEFKNSIFHRAAAFNKFREYLEKK